MQLNPSFSVRFYVRTTKTQGGDSPTPLRAKVWIAGTKSYLYFSTKVTTTKRMWADFSTDGTPSAGADPDLVKSVDFYKTAAQLVMSSAIANGRLELLTSEILTLRVQSIVALLEKQLKNPDITTPILIFTTPRNVPTCADCIYRGGDAFCKAPWQTDAEKDMATDLALYNKKCSMHHIQPTTDENILSRMLILAIAKIQQEGLSVEEALKATSAPMVAYLKRLDAEKEDSNGNKE